MTDQINLLIYDAVVGSRPPADVVLLVSNSTCPRCGLLTEDPHRTERDCIRALDFELRSVIKRYRALTTTRVALLDGWLQNLRSVVDTSTKERSQKETRTEHHVRLLRNGKRAL
jgi:hypothetical protein